MAFFLISVGSGCHSASSHTKHSGNNSITHTRTAAAHARALVCVCACATYIRHCLLYWLCLSLLLHSPDAHVPYRHPSRSHQMFMTRLSHHKVEGVNGWQASDHGSGLRLDIHNGAPLHIFEEATGDFPAAFTMIKPGVLAIFVAKNGCFLEVSSLAVFNPLLP